MQTPRLVSRIAEIHRYTLDGMTKCEAELGYLETASKLAMYGVCSARCCCDTGDAGDNDLSIGVCATGILGWD